LICGSGNAMCAPSYFTNSKNRPDKKAGPYVWTGVADIYDGSVLHPALVKVDPKGKVDLSRLSEPDKAPPARSRAEAVLNQGCADLRALGDSGEPAHPELLRVGNHVGSYVGNGDMGGQYAYYALAEAFTESGRDSNDWERAIQEGIENGATHPAEPHRTLEEMFPPDFIAKIIAASPPLVPKPSRLIFFGERPATSRSRPLIKGLLSTGATSSLFGPPKTNKSTLVVDMMAHLSGRPEWRGMRIPEPKACLYLAFERYMQVLDSLDGYAAKGFESLPIAVLPELVDVVNPACIDEVVRLIDETEKRFGMQVGLVAFDTWSKGLAAGGGNEDKAEDQNRAAANLRRIIERFPHIHCMTVGHTGKDANKGERGSNATRGDRDVGLSIRRDGEIRVLRVDYANGIEDEKDIAAFKVDAVEIGKDEEGEPITGLTVSEKPYPIPGERADGLRLTARDKLALNALRDVMKMKGERRDEVGNRFCVLFDEWLDRAHENGTVKPNAAKPERDLNDVMARLIERHKAGYKAPYVWLAESNVVPLVGGAVPMRGGSIALPPLPGK
jgi:hypothetical protein